MSLLSDTRGDTSPRLDLHDWLVSISDYPWETGYVSWELNDAHWLAVLVLYRWNLSHELLTRREMSLGHTSVPATRCRNSSRFESMKQAAGTKFCPRGSFSLVHTVGFVVGACHCDMSPWFDASCVLTLSDESVEDKLQRSHERISCCMDCHEHITYTRMTIATYKIARLSGS